MNMLFYRKYEIADNERALLFYKKRFRKILKGGTYRFWGVPVKYRAEIFDITIADFYHLQGEFLFKENQKEFEQHVARYQVGDLELGLVFFDNKLVDIIAPGETRMFWKGVHEIRVDIVNIGEEFELSYEQKVLLRHSRALRSGKYAAEFVYYREVADNQVGLLFVNGVLQGVLEPGDYAFWTPNRSVGIQVVDKRVQLMEVSGQEILTKDKVSLRINLTASFKVEDPKTALTELSDYQDFLYKKLQFGLREAVGTKLLDALLSNKDVIRTDVENYIVDVAKEYGLAVKNVGVKDIILPGEMKTILNQVVEAEKAAEANLIRRREETSATRSLNNTAKMMENNPTLLRLKELEVLERVTDRIGNITVFGGLEGILNDFIKLPK